MKIRKGDKVVVLSGKDRGREGNVVFAYPDKGRDRRRRQRGHAPMTAMTLPFGKVILIPFRIGRRS